MPTTSDVHVGDIGTHYRARLVSAGAAFDPSAATVSKLLFRPPRAAAFERPATITTDGTDWFLSYQLVEGTDDHFHGKPGLWRWQGFLEFPDGQRYHTKSSTYMVRPNIATPPPTLTTVVQFAASFAQPNQGLAVALWYDRRLQRVGSSALTLTVQSSDPSRYPDQVLPFAPSQSHLEIESPYGQAQIVYLLAPLDLTGADNMTFRVNEASAREGWAQLRDLETGQPLATMFRPFDVGLFVEATTSVGPNGVPPNRIVVPWVA